MTEIHHPHDRGYKALLSSEAIFLELLQSFVNMGWVSQIDADSLTKMDTTYILQDFSEKEADLVYRIKIKDEDVIFYVLLEMQSRVDFQMPYRLLIYMMGIWRDLLKNTDPRETERKSFRLPSIVPIVLYNSSERWTACRSFKQTLSAGGLFGEYVVDFKYILIDVNRYDKASLSQLDNFIGSVFKMDQSVDPREYRNRLLELGPTLRKFDSQKFQLFISWLKMATEASGLSVTAKQAIRAILEESQPEEAEKMVSNMAETLGRFYEDGKQEGFLSGIEKGIEKGIEQGIEKGIEKGVEQTKLETARKMLALGMAEDVIQQVTGLSPDQVKALRTENAGKSH